MGKKIVAYERLERFDIVTGELRGAHVKFFEWVTDDAGNIIPGTGKDSDAVSIAKAEELGFPLTAILSGVENGALLAMESAATAHAEALAAKDAANTKALADKDAANAAQLAQLTDQANLQISTLRATIANMQAQIDGAAK